MYTINQEASSKLYTIYTNWQTILWQDSQTILKDELYYITKFQTAVEESDFCQEFTALEDDPMHTYYLKGQNNMIEHYSTELKSFHKYLASKVH